MTQEVNALWYARLPLKWATEPTWMSVSALLNMEACPRRWSLSYADYPDIWERRGYPPKPYLAALTGQIIHSALESITKSLSYAGCSSINDPLFVSVLRELGGYTKIIEAKLGHVITKLNDNPRSQHNADFIAMKLRAQIPELRARLQMLVSKLRLQAGSKSNAERTIGAPIARTALSNGSHVEIELRAERLRWHGFVDCLNLSDTTCEIVDFKTGAAKPEHEFQIQVYSLLWSRDTESNPTARLVNRLALSYPAGEVEPLTAPELDDFERALMTRTRTALNLIRQDPPPAYPSVQNCPFCPVRQMCDVYWDTEVQQHLKTERLKDITIQAQTVFADLEVELRERQSLTSWVAVVTMSGELASRTPVSIQFTQTSMSVLNALKVGSRLRLIDSYIVNQVEDETSSTQYVMLNRASEVFIVPVR